MTSGPGGSHNWVLRWPHPQKWGNPLMGWLSSADSLSPLAMHAQFESPEQAIFFCERNGWKWRVEPQPPTERTPVYNQYAHNFVSRAFELQTKAIGPRRTTKIFAQERPGASHFVNMRRSTFGAEPWLPASDQTAAAWVGPGWPAPKPAAAAH